MTRFVLVIATFFLLIAGTFSARAATTQCTYSFTSGTGNSFLNFCVTVNGNIPVITTPQGDVQLSSAGEGYGVCDQNAPADYNDYGTSETGNWNAPVLISHINNVSVKIARTTSDGHWTLTQTITNVPKTSSITVVMALRNNQTVADVAYLVRYAHPDPEGQFEVGYGATTNSAFVIGNDTRSPFGDAYLPGLQLQNVGNPQFGSLSQGFAQIVSTGPNACAFAFNANSTPFAIAEDRDISIEVAYVGNVPAGGTRTVTLSYHGL